MAIFRDKRKDISGTTTGRDSKYDIAFTTYPRDLFNSAAEKYAKSWVMFNINVQSQSSYLVNSSIVQLTEAERRRSTNFDTRNQSVRGAIAAGTTSAAVTGGVLKLSSALNSGQASRALVGAVQGAASGMAAIAPATLLAGTAKRETKRIAEAIQLPMPNNLITGYTMDWGSDNTNLFDMMLRAPAAGVEALVSAVTGNFQKALTGLGRQTADAATALSLGANAFLQNEGVSAMTGLAANPKKELIFQGVGFRTLTLEYKFFPKDEDEMVDIDTIIRLFKFHMHPEYKSEGRYTFIYPSEFDITFFTNTGEENPWVAKIATSVLTDMRVNYTPEGNWVAHPGGAPNAITIILTFKELSILTKDDIKLGF